MLSGSSEVFGWNSGHGASQYWLYVGTTGAGSVNVYDASAGTNLSATVTGIPTTGTIYVRLWTLLPTGWVWSDYTYTGGIAAALTIPPPGTILSGSAATFGWNSVTGAAEYWLYVGTTGVGSFNIHNASTGLALSAGVTGIPTSGTIYVRLWTFDGVWRSNDYTYTGGGAAAMQTPIPGSSLSSSTTTFNWNTGTAVDQYWLYVGTTGVGSADIFNSSTGVIQTATVTGLPTSDTIYVRLWSHLASGWVWNDYRYTGRGAAELKWPVPGTTLSGSSVAFNWNAGNGASDYWLYVGTTGVGSANIYSASAGTSQLALVSNVPTSGTVYVRMWTLLAGGWTSNDYTYTGGAAIADGAGAAPR
jgi:serine protease